MIFNPENIGLFMSDDTRIRPQMPGKQYWTKEGKLEKETENKDRIILGSGKDESLGVAILSDSGLNKKSKLSSLYARAFHVKLNVTNEDNATSTYNVNIFSLSKRINVSVIKILFAKDLDTLVKVEAEKTEIRAQENQILYEGKKEEIEEMQGKDSDQIARNCVITARKTDNATNQAFTSLDKLSDVMMVYVPGKKGSEEGGVITYKLHDEKKLLGSGAAGDVYELEQKKTFGIWKNTPPPAVIKVAKPLGIGDMKNGHRILKIIHKNGRVKGIQQAPHAIVVLSPKEEEQGRTAYIAPRYNFDINSCQSKQDKLPISELQKACSNLANGIASAHNQNIVHGDIKPANTAQVSIDGDTEYCLADWEGASQFEDFDINLPFGSTLTPFFTEDNDRNQAYINRILYLASKGEYPSTQENLSEIRKYLTTFHPLVKKIILDLFSNSPEQIMFPSEDAKTAFSDVEEYRANMYGTPEQIMKSLLEIRKAHDIRSLGMTYINMFAYNGLDNNAIHSKYPVLSNMLVKMVDSDYKKRPSAEEVNNFFENWKPTHELSVAQVLPAPPPISNFDKACETLLEYISNVDQPASYLKNFLASNKLEESQLEEFLRSVNNNPKKPQYIDISYNKQYDELTIKISKLSASEVILLIKKDNIIPPALKAWIDMGYPEEELKQIKNTVREIVKDKIYKTLDSLEENKEFILNESIDLLRIIREKNYNEDVQEIKATLRSILVEYSKEKGKQILIINEKIPQTVKVTPPPLPQQS